MPKKVSKRKPKRQPKKVSRKKSKKVTKRKPKYKRRKRRFGSSIVNNLQEHLEPYGGVQLSNDTNTPIQALARGDEHKKSFDYKGFLQRISGEKGVQALYNTFNNNRAFTKIGKDDPDAILKRHKAFHTVLVAIISAILQLTDKVGRLQGSKIYTKVRQESKFLSIVSKRQTYSDSGLQKYANLPVEQTGITDFEIFDSNGVVTGFKHNFRNQTFEVSIFGRQQGNNLFIKTLFRGLASRLPALRQEKKVDAEFLRVASAYNDSFTTVVNLPTGEIVSTQDPEYNDKLITDLRAMTLNPFNTIATNVEEVNETLKTFKNSSEEELSEGIDQLSLSINPSEFSNTNPFLNFQGDGKLKAKDSVDDDPFAEFGPSKYVNVNPSNNMGPEIKVVNEKDDGKPFAKNSDDDNPFDGFFGRRKKKVSKKKGPSAALKKLCKSLKVKLTTKRGGKRVYKSEKVLKAQCKKAAKKSSFGKSKKKVSKKKGPSSALKKLCKKFKVKLTVKRGGKRVYKSDKVLKELCKKAAKKSSKPKKKVVRRKRTSK